MKKLIVLFIFFLLINFPEPNVNEYEGKAIFAFVAIKTTNATIPEKYVGVLKDVNITLYGDTTLIVFHLPLLFPSVLITNETILLRMKFFIGALYWENGYACILGYAFMVKWEW